MCTRAWMHSLVAASLSSSYHRSQSVTPTQPRKAIKAIHSQCHIRLRLPPQNKITHPQPPMPSLPLLLLLFCCPDCRHYSKPTKGCYAKPDPLFKKREKKTKRSDYCDHMLVLCIPESMCTHSRSQCWNTGTYRQRQVFRQGFENSSNLSDHLIVVRAEGQRTFAHLSLIDKELKHYKNRQGCVI